MSGPTSMWKFRLYHYMSGPTSMQGVQSRMVLVVNVFVFYKLSFVCFVGAICDLVHDVEATFYLP